MAKARRRWKAWDRFNHRCIEVGGERHRASRGAWKAYNEKARWHNRKVNRQAKLDAERIVADVVAAMDKRMPVAVSCDGCGVRSVVSSAAQMRSWLDFHECDLAEAVQP